MKRIILNKILFDYKQTYFCIALMLVISFVHGQSYEISGRTFNEAGKKIGPSNIIVYDANKKRVAELEDVVQGYINIATDPALTRPTYHNEAPANFSPLPKVT